MGLMKCDNTREHKKVMRSMNGWKDGCLDEMGRDGVGRMGG